MDYKGFFLETVINTLIKSHYILHIYIYVYTGNSLNISAYDKQFSVRVELSSFMGNKTLPFYIPVVKAKKYHNSLQE